MTKSEILISIFTIVFIIGAILFYDSATIVSAGEQAVVTRYGAIRPITLNPGIHFITPLMDNAHVFDVKEQKEEAHADSASKDLQSVNTTIALNYHLNPEKVNQLYQEVGRDYKYRIIDPSIQESVKAATANFSAEELITKRPEVKDQLLKSLTERLGNRFITVNDVSIVNFSFSEEFNKSIEAKQVAQQNALKAEQDLKRIEIEAKQKIETAKADAESLRLQRENVTPDLVELKAIEKWDGKLPTYTGGVVPFINQSVQTSK